MDHQVDVDDEEEQEEEEGDDVDEESLTTTTQSKPHNIYHHENAEGKDICKKVWMQVKSGYGPHVDPLRQLQLSSTVIRSGYRSSASERAIKPPVYRSSTFEFASAEEGELFYRRAYNLKGNDGNAPGLIHSRLNNPNTEILEDKMVALERGAHFASAFPSGMSAISTSLMALVPNGGHVLYTNSVYGGTHFFLETICPGRLGISCQSVDTSDKEALRTAVEQAHRLDLLYIETPANPTLALTDIEFASNLARMKNGECLVVVDNTFMGPVFQSPFLHGADVVLYSASMFLGGHSDLLAGIVITNSEDLIYKIDGFRTILGPAISPDVAWMVTRSLETLWMRMDKQAQKATKVAAALGGHPTVEKVFFPGHFSSELSSSVRDEKIELWERQCTGTGSIITIVIRPNVRIAAYTFLNALEVVHLAVGLGGTETLVEHPRSMSHSNVSDEDLDGCGIVEGMIRISIGLESSKDIIKDLLSALDRVLHGIANDDYESVHSC